TLPDGESAVAAVDLGHSARPSCRSPYATISAALTMATCGQPPSSTVRTRIASPLSGSASNAAKAGGTVGPCSSLTPRPFTTCCEQLGTAPAWTDPPTVEPGTWGSVLLAPNGRLIAGKQL